MYVLGGQAAGWEGMGVVLHNTKQVLGTGSQIPLNLNNIYLEIKFYRLGI